MLQDSSFEEKCKKKKNSYFKTINKDIYLRIQYFIYKFKQMY